MFYRFNESISICSACRNQAPIFSSFMIYHQVCNKCNTTTVTCGAGTVYLPGAPEFTPVFSGFRVDQSLIYSVLLCMLMFVLFRLTITFSVLLGFTFFDFPFDIIKLFLKNCKIKLNLNKLQYII
jgi:hypothetical protein